MSQPSRHLVLIIALQRPEPSDANLRVSISRIYAEVLLALGNPQATQAIVRHEQLVREGQVKPVVASQFWSVRTQN